MGEGFFYMFDVVLGFSNRRCRKEALQAMMNGRGVGKAHIRLLVGYLRKRGNFRDLVIESVLRRHTIDEYYNIKMGEVSRITGKNSKRRKEVLAQKLDLERARKKIELDEVFAK